MSATEFTEGDIVKCMHIDGSDLYGQVVGVRAEENEIEVCTAVAIGIDTSILVFEDYATWQPVECVREHVPVNCSFENENEHTADIVGALCEAWKYWGLVPLDESTLWRNGEAPHVSTGVPIVSPEHAEIVERCWGAELASGLFEEFCLGGDYDESEDKYDSDDSFIDNGDTEGFTVARDGSAFVDETHDAVRYMSYARGQNETERQQRVRAFLNHMHTRVAHAE